MRLLLGMLTFLKARSVLKLNGTTANICFKKWPKYVLKQKSPCDITIFLLVKKRFPYNVNLYYINERKFEEKWA
jgi:hypothetical protein